MEILSKPLLEVILFYKKLNLHIKLIWIRIPMKQNNFFLFLWTPTLRTTGPYTKLCFLFNVMIVSHSCRLSALVRNNHYNGRKIHFPCEVNVSHPTARTLYLKSAIESVKIGITVTTPKHNVRHAEIWIFVLVW